MSNGYTQAEMLDRIEMHVLRIEAKLDNTIVKGCALAPEHERRLSRLESSKSKGIGAVVAALLAALGALIMAIGSHIAAGK